MRRHEAIEEINRLHAKVEMETADDSCQKCFEKQTLLLNLTC